MRGPEEDGISKARRPGEGKAGPETSQGICAWVFPNYEEFNFARLA